MSYISWLRWGAIGSIFAVLFVPFVVADGGASWGAAPLTYIPMANSFFPFITGKNFVFRILVELAVVLYVLLALKRPEYRPRTSHVFWAFTIFVAWIGVTTALSVDPLKSFWSNFERMEGYISLLHLFGYFVVAGSILSAEKLWDRFLATSVGASAYMGLLALLQIMGAMPISSQSGARADTTFGNATYLAVYMLVHFFLTLYLLSRERVSRGMQAYYGVVLVLQGAAIYYTQTRGALLGLVGGLIVAALWIAIRGRSAEYQPLRRIAFGGLASIVVLAGLFFVLRDTALIQSSDTLKRVADISLTDRTTQSRFMIWGMAAQGALERPITGWGLENFSYVFNKYYDPEMYNQEAWFDRAHNQFLDWLVAGGVPAFLLYVSLYIFAALAIIRSQLLLPQQAALLGLLAAYAFNNSLVFDNLVGATFFFVVVALAHSLSRKELPGWIALTRPLSDRAVAVAAPLVVLVVLGLGWSFNVPALVRAQLLTSAINTPPEVGLPLFKRALGPTLWPGSALGRQEATEQLMQYTSQVASAEGIDPSDREEVVAMAYEAGQTLLAQRQNDARLELFMSSMLGQLGNTKEALKYAEAAVTHSPDKQQLLFQLGFMQLQAKDIEAALQTFKKALTLAPEYELANIMYAAAQYYAGDLQGGDATLRKAFGNVVVNNDQLLRIYVDIKQYDRAAAIWQMRIDNEPTHIDHRLRLAELYLRAGNKDKSIEVLRGAAAIRPDLALQIEQLITQIQQGLLNL